MSTFGDETAVANNNTINISDSSFTYANLQVNFLRIGNNTNTSTLSVTNYTGTANNATFAYGKQESQLIAGTATTANNASFLNGRIWETAGAIGSTVANTGAFTTLTASANVNLDSGTLFTDATNNRVGINTTTPSIAFQVGNRGGFGSDGVLYWGQDFTSGNRGFLSWNANTASVNAANTLIFGTNTSVERMRITNLGNVGIGNTNPERTFHVTSTGLVSTLLQSTTSSSYLDIVDGSNNYLRLGSFGGVQGLAATPTTTPTIAITSTGRVGINTNTPQTPFVVSNAGAGGLEFDGSTGLIQSYNRSTSAYQTMLFDAATIVFRPSGTEAARITATGNVAIGSTAAPTRLFVNGHMSVANGFGIFANGVLGANGLVLTSNGTSLFWGSVSATSASTANNASFLNGRIWETAGAIGATVANTGAFTTLTASANVNLDSGTLFVDGPANRVGVGTATPSTRFHVGTKVSDDNVYVYDGNTAMVVHQQPTSTTVLNDPKETLLLARQGTSGQAYGAAVSFDLSRYENNSVNSRTRLDFKLAHASFLATPTIAMTMLSSGNIGLGGNTTPGQTLQVDGSVGIKNGLVANGSLGTAGLVLTSNGSVAYWANASAISGTVATANNASFLAGRRWETAGAIGSTVANTGAFTTLTASANVNIDSGTLFVDGTSNRVGVNITTPLHAHHVSGSVLAAGDASSVAYYMNDSQAIRSSGTMYIDADTSGQNGFTRAGTGDLIFRTAAAQERMRIISGGNIGIGNTTPGQRLQVDGSVGIKNGLVANGTFGISGQVLTSNGTVSYWANTSAGGFTGNTVSANATIVKNQSYYVNAAAGWVNMTMPSTVVAGDIFIVHSETGNTRILNNSINIMNVGSGNDLLLESGQTVWVQAVNTSSVGIMFTYPAGGTPAVVANSTFATSANNALYLQGRTWETAGAIGSTVANTGTFTTLTASTISLNGNTTFNTSTFAINPTFKAYREAVGANTVSTASTVIDVSTFNVFNLSMTLNTTVSFTNPPASGTAYSFMLYCKQDGVGSRTITWPASVKWPNSSVPTMSTGANKIDVFNFFTLDGGTTYLGALSLANTG
jgi:hypothetical protein